MQEDKPRLPMADEGVSCMESLIASGLESSSNPRHLTDRHWFGRASRLEVFDTDLNHSFDLGNSRFLPDTPSIASMGNLVCSTSAVSALPPSKLLEAESSFNDAPSQNGLHSSTYQAPRRDGEVEVICQGLASINRGHMHQCGITDVFDPLTPRLKTIVMGESLVGSQPPLCSNVSNLLYPTPQPAACPYESPNDGGFMIASPIAQNAPFVDLGAAISYEDVRHRSSFRAMSDAQAVVELRSFFGPAPNDEASLSADQLLFPELAINSPDYQDKCKTKMISVYCCPHHDCDYTAKIWRDVERHLGSKKHGGSSSRFPCTIEGCNALKEHTRRDNLRRHMKTVHGVIMPEMRKGRREKRYRVQSQAQQ
ncbi:hypothetical protein G7054_g7586 [Neopestalotiopsis clavispora]|nr:hypothetical protein G7054_g7586 [Neopestalotiopsis clavispora]